jgi:hypothetical protein
MALYRRRSIDRNHLGRVALATRHCAADLSMMERDLTPPQGHKRDGRSILQNSGTGPPTTSRLRGHFDAALTCDAMCMPCIEDAAACRLVELRWSMGFWNEQHRRWLFGCTRERQSLGRRKRLFKTAAGEILAKGAMTLTIRSVSMPPGTHLVVVDEYFTIRMVTEGQLSWEVLPPGSSTPKVTFTKERLGEIVWACWRPRYNSSCRTDLPVR